MKLKRRGIVAWFAIDHSRPQFWNPCLEPLHAFCILLVKPGFKRGSFWRNTKAYPSTVEWFGCGWKTRPASLLAFSSQQRYLCSVLTHNHLYTVKLPHPTPSAAAYHFRQLRWKSISRLGWWLGRALAALLVLPKGNMLQSIGGFGVSEENKSGYFEVLIWFIYIYRKPPVEVE